MERSNSAAEKEVKDENTLKEIEKLGHSVEWHRFNFIQWLAESELGVLKKD